MTKINPNGPIDNNKQPGAIKKNFEEPKAEEIKIDFTNVQGDAKPSEKSINARLSTINNLPTLKT